MLWVVDVASAGLWSGRKPDLFCTERGLLSTGVGPGEEVETEGVLTGSQGL